MLEIITTICLHLVPSINTETTVFVLRRWACAFTQNVKLAVSLTVYWIPAGRRALATGICWKVFWLVDGWRYVGHLQESVLTTYLRKVCRLPVGSCSGHLLEGSATCQKDCWLRARMCNVPARVCSLIAGRWAGYLLGGLAQLTTFWEVCLTTERLNGVLANCRETAYLLKGVLATC